MKYNAQTIDKQHKCGDLVWGTAFRYDSTKEGMALKCEPVLGMLSYHCTDVPDAANPTKPIRYFVPIRKNGKGYSWSKAVYLESRQYADTEAEAWMAYEQEIKKAKEWHEDNAKKLGLLMEEARKKAREA